MDEDDLTLEYDLTPEQRLHRYLERLPVVGQPLSYNSDVCELPPEMMFMHDAIFSLEEKVENPEVWEQINQVTPEIDKVWEVVKSLRGRVEELENELARLRGVASAAGTKGVVATA